MRSGRRSWMLICAAVSVSAGCTFLLGLEDVQLAEEATGGGGAGGNGGAGAGPTTSSAGGVAQGGGGSAGGTVCEMLCDTQCNGTVCAPYTLVEGETTPVGVVLSTSHVYWIAGDNVRRIAKTAQMSDTPEPMFTQTDLKEIALCGNNDICGVTGSMAVRAPATMNSSATQIPNSSGGTAIASDGTDVYWTQGMGPTIQRAGIITGNSMVYVDLSGQNSAQDLAIITSGVYWTTSDSVQRANFTGAVEPVDDGNTTGPLFIASDGDAKVCWTQASPPRVYCSTSPTVAPAEITTNSAPSAVAIPRNAYGLVYWAEDGAIQRRLISAEPGSLVEETASGQGTITSLSADAEYVFWTTMGGTVMRQKILPPPPQ